MAEKRIPEYYAQLLGEFYNSAKDYIEEGKWEEAKKELENILQEPEGVTPSTRREANILYKGLKELSNTLSELGLKKPTKEDTTQIAKEIPIYYSSLLPQKIQKTPENEQALEHYNRAQTYFAEDRWNDALDELAKIKKIDNVSPAIKYEADKFSTQINLLDKKLKELPSKPLKKPTIEASKELIIAKLPKDVNIMKTLRALLPTNVSKSKRKISFLSTLSPEKQNSSLKFKYQIK